MLPIAGVSSLLPPMASAAAEQAAVHLAAFFSSQLNFSELFLYKPFFKNMENTRCCVGYLAKRM